MTLHTLKIVPGYYDAVRNGIKPFEIRKNDRDYKVGDTLRLREYNPDLETDVDAERFTGRDVRAAVTYIITHDMFPNGIPEGYCVMGIRVIE